MFKGGGKNTKHPAEKVHHLTTVVRVKKEKKIKGGGGAIARGEKGWEETYTSLGENKYLFLHQTREGKRRKESAILK